MLSLHQDDPDIEVPTLGEIIFTVFDWMTTNKETITSTKDIYEYTRSLFPVDNNMCGFEEVMTILRRHRLETLQTIPVCVQMCVPYWNPTHHKMQGPEYRNAHRTRCPKCGEERMFSGNSQGMEMVDSSKIAWKCKLLVATGANSGMALPYASCTPKEEVELY